LLDSQSERYKVSVKLTLYMMRNFFILTALIFTSCGSYDPGDAVRLSSWVSSPIETQLMRSTVDSFRTAHPDIEVKYEPIPGSYSEKIQLMLGTSTAPDLFYLKDMVAPSYLRYDVLEPLNEYVEGSPEFDTEDFFPFLRNAFSKDSIYYGFSKDYNPYVLFYNADMFAKAGITEPPQNWAELKSAAARLTIDTDGDGKIDQYGLVIEPVIEMLIPFVYQNGGTFQDDEGRLRFTEPEFVEALDYYSGLHRSGVAALPSEVGSGWNGDAFGREYCAMIIAGGWALPFLDETHPDVNYELAFMPAGKVRATVAFTTAYVMPKSSQKKKESWQLLSYLAGKKGMAEWTSLGLAMPARRSVAEKNGFYDHPRFKWFVNSAEFARLFQVTYVERWYDEAQATMQEVFFLKEDPAVALNKLKTRIEKFRLN